MHLLSLQVTGLALHFPITAGGNTHQHSLQERVRGSVPACLPAMRSSQLPLGAVHQLVQISCRPLPQCRRSSSENSTDAALRVTL